MPYRTIDHSHFTVEIEEPQIYINNQARFRSGHVSHAMAEYAPGKVIDFNANYSPVRGGGHSNYGWIEYRLSEDGGRTFSESHDLPYSVRSFLDGLWTISVEKAVGGGDGSIVAFCLRNTMLEEICGAPHLTPTCVRSEDGGKTWSEPYECIPYKGRIYDAVYRDGVIYVLIFCNEYFTGQTPEDVYRVYVSADNGRSFQERSVIPYPTTLNHAYGSLLFDTEGRLHAYSYNRDAERMMEHAVSTDDGATWEILRPCYLPLGIRNPQTALIDGVYVLHGRGDNDSKFVFYTSEDATVWDAGLNIGEMKSSCYYSNNLNLRDEKGNYLLVQYSDRYDGSGRVNVMHLKLRIKKK